MKTTEKLLMMSGALGFAFSIAQCGDITNRPPYDLPTPADLAFVADLTTFAPPTITAVTPAFTANNVSTPISVSGTGFRSGATVTVGGVACNTPVVVSATTISCTVPARANTCGGQSVVVTNVDQQATTKVSGFSFASATFTLALATPPTVAVGNTPRKLASSDLNGDGKLDLVVANSQGSTFSILIGNGDGTFKLTTSPTTGSIPADIAVADANHTDKFWHRAAPAGAGFHTGWETAADRPQPAPRFPADSYFLFL